MKKTRVVLMTASSLLVVCLLGGGLALRVGAAENSYHQTVVFAEILSLVLDNYVDPVETDDLLRGAYEGMLGGLDPNGTYLTPPEVEQWKSGGEAAADPGLSVLKVGRVLQVVAVDEGSAADEAGIVVGDHVRTISGRGTGDISLRQARRLMRGEAGSTVVVEVLKSGADFVPQRLELERRVRGSRPYELSVERGIAVLRLREIAGLSLDELAEELDDVHSRGTELLLVDVRNTADDAPRDVAALVDCFVGGTLLRLRDASGRLVEAIEGDEAADCWPGRIALLVNGATAGGAEALVAVLHSERKAVIFGESTYGYGAEPKLFELENGAGLLVSAAIWESSDGTSWHLDGLEPDTVVRGTRGDFDESLRKQMLKVLELLEIAESADTGQAA